MTVPTSHILILAAALFTLGVVGFLTRRNAITVLMCVELMLNAVNLTVLAAARHHFPGNDLGLAQGSIFVIFVIAVAACEAAVGLALAIALFRHERSVDLEAATDLKG